jgi:methylmalonyl-CoA mutase N-terminal domain/subunit
MLACIESGKIQTDILKNAYEIEKKKQNGEIAVIGVNKFVDDQKKDEEIQLTEIDPKIIEKQMGKLKFIKERRDQERVQESLKRLKERAQGDTNLVPVIQEAVKEYATVGEICGCLKEVFGEHRESMSL